MCIYYVKHPMKAKPIGMMHTTLASAKRGALRAAKRLGHAHIDHWREGRVTTIFADASEVLARSK